MKFVFFFCAQGTHKLHGVILLLVIVFVQIYLMCLSVVFFSVCLCACVCGVSVLDGKRDVGGSTSQWCYRHLAEVCAL